LRRDPGAEDPFQEWVMSKWNLIFIFVDEGMMD
jgi:hypothetical protein